MVQAWKARIANSRRPRGRHHAFNFGRKVSEGTFASPSANTVRAVIDLSQSATVVDGE
jgi:hypothetical protein